MKLKLIITMLLFMPMLINAQLTGQKKKYTKEDTLRGSLNENRDWWNVQRYDIEVKPDYEKKSITGVVHLTFRYVRFPKVDHEELLNQVMTMQLDLQEPLLIDSIITTENFIWNTAHPSTTFEKVQLPFKQKGNIAEVAVSLKKTAQTAGNLDTLTIYYHGTPREAKNAPWDGGWIWKKDSLNRPWMSVAVQGTGASAWYPCKDHQSDEPDNGASLTVIVPDSLVAVANGRFSQESSLTEVDWIPGKSKDFMSFSWGVKNPINNYNIIPYIGKYANWNDTLNGEKGKLDLGYWILDYNLERSKQQFQQVKSTLHCFEHWFGPYPFYEDGYKLVEAPHLGMEHQSAVAYGNKYKNGYLGMDLSRTGWGAKWDYIIVHETGHEWFGNNITTKDIADMWVHEGFTCYSETLYTEWLFGKQAGDEYNAGIRRNIDNKSPVIGPYGVNEEGSGDMYAKGANMIHIIRKVINDDEKFRQILRGLNSTFRHQVVTTHQVESYIIKQSGINFQKTFDQYLRTINIPELEIYFSKDKEKVNYRWTNCIEGFDLPLVIDNKKHSISTNWNSSKISAESADLWNKTAIEKLYYIKVKEVSEP